MNDIKFSEKNSVIPMPDGDKRIYEVVLAALAVLALALANMLKNS